MRKKKTREVEGEEKEEEEEEEEKGKNGKEGFHACYLLTSLSPRFKGHTYIGYTVNPQRRIRQHNGEIGSGAYRTKKRRPWEMVLCLFGFPTNVSALQFEWAWQHPMESKAVRQSAATFKSFSGVANKIKLAYTMLNLPPWQSLNITINYFSTKYTLHCAGCPTLPNNIKVRVCPMNELLCCTKIGESLTESEDDEGSLGSKSDKEPDKDNETSSGDEIPKILECLFHDNECEEAQNTTIRQPTFINLTMEKEPSTFQSFSSTRLRENNVLELIDECDREAYWPERETSTRKFDNIEVIDLLSPSPQCRLRSISKKRRVSVICHEIIDLT